MHTSAGPHAPRVPTYAVLTRRHLSARLDTHACARAGRCARAPYSARIHKHTHVLSHPLKQMPAVCTPAGAEATGSPCGRSGCSCGCGWPVRLLSVSWPLQPPRQLAGVKLSARRAHEMLMLLMYTFRAGPKLPGSRGVPVCGCRQQQAAGSERCKRTRVCLPVCMCVCVRVCTRERGPAKESVHGRVQECVRRLQGE